MSSETQQTTVEEELQSAALALIQSGQKFYVMVTGSKKDGWLLHAFKTVTQGIRYFEDGYNDCHQRGGSWSNSACINYMFFQPSIVWYNSMQEIQEKLFPNGVPGVVMLRNPAGIFYVAPIENGQVEWDRGEKPRLISDPHERSNSDGGGI